jgi:hypothetical protein
MARGRFAGLSERLLRGGIGPRRVRRLISELEAHFDDLVAEFQLTGLSQAESESQATVRLGTDDVLAASILARTELRSWARQWPWLAFAVLPLLSLPVQFVLSMLLAVGVISFSVHILGLTALHPGPVPWICEVLQAYALWIAPMLSAGAACFFAARYRAPALWPIVGGILVAFLGAMTNTSFDWSPALPKGELSAGIGFPGRGAAMGLRIMLTLGTILAPFLWATRRESGVNRTYLPRDN